MTVHDRNRIDLQHPITVLKARARRRTLRQDVADQWFGPGRDDADALKQPGVRLARIHALQGQSDVPPHSIARGCDREPNIVSVQRAAGQQPAKRFKRTHRIGIPSSHAALADPLTAPKSGPFGNRSGDRAGEHRLRFLDTNPVHDAVKKHRQQQIGERTGSHIWHRSREDAAIDEGEVGGEP